MKGKAPLYQLDSYRRQLSTKVVEARPGKRPSVVLADTILYPEGGGQPSDRGWIGGLEVVALERRGGQVLHYLEKLPPEATVEVRLDWTRRFDHMQQHTAQHLLTALAADNLGWQTTSFHLGEERSDIELDVSQPTPDQISELEEMAAQAIRDNRDVKTRFVSLQEYSTLPVRSRGLPGGHEGDIRLVEIEGIDLNTCGGTHVSSTAQLEVVKLLGQESIRGGTRLYFVAGARVRRRLAAHERRAGALRKLLGTSDEEIANTVKRRLDELRGADREIRSLQNQLADARAELLAEQEGSILAAHFHGIDIRLLQMLARKVVEKRPEAQVFLTSEQAGKGGVFVLAAGEDSPADLRVSGPRAAEILGGRGGGSGQMFQGKASDLTARDQVVEILGE